MLGRRRVAPPPASPASPPRGPLPPARTIRTAPVGSQRAAGVVGRGWQSCRGPPEFHPCRTARCEPRRPRAGWRTLCLAKHQSAACDQEVCPLRPPSRPMVRRAWANNCSSPKAKCERPRPIAMMPTPAMRSMHMKARNCIAVGTSLHAVNHGAVVGRLSGPSKRDVPTRPAFPAGTPNRKPVGPVWVDDADGSPSALRVGAREASRLERRTRRRSGVESRGGRRVRVDHAHER